ncbi:substrate-binding domain-containing protein [Robertkochia solimangrovi]|uniref:substrate-binding domain-containing protein n=1 Tax=Robertkochia solimangrovi TaxID=2213046 RepID=UPI00117CD7FC|nr:substrate-binding domain-containing protein [Robertkochia solimangrovi]TRZ45260.1 ABC transporter substrate-binding protein [Robertkochia solimangrovi]
MKKVNIIGVPEHFNLPWHLAIDEGAFRERGFDLEWTDIPEGTGKMCEMLREGSTDLAVILTEGIVKDIINGNDSSIIQVYVESPLYWGIHVDSHSKFKNIEDLKGATAAISRYGSGSHLMSYINASEHGWPVSELKFKVVNDIQGAVKALQEQEADYFMWEHFTTKPLVDKGVFRRISDCPTPWPCFVIAARNEFINNNLPVLKHLLEVINVFTAEFKFIPSIDRMLANRYEQDVSDIREWLAITRWSQEAMDPLTLKNIQEQLLKLGIIEDTFEYSRIATIL